MSDLDYYQIAKQASSQIGEHQGLLYLQDKALSSKKILDLGCGEGTRLNTLLPKNKKGTGVDISKAAIAQAKKQYPHHQFLCTKDETLPFKDDSFDLVYSTFVLEHTRRPEKFLSEALRVLSPQGQLVIICPNYGAPNRRSPNSTEKPIAKLLAGLSQDYFPKNPNSLSFTKVKPSKNYYQVDDDTTVEPYLLTLERYFKSQGLKVIKSSSLWNLEAKTLNPRKLLFFFFGKLSLFSFKYWGPQAFIVVEK